MRYTQEQISTALVLLKATGSLDKVILTLGYPSSPMLYRWRDKYPEYCDVPNQKHWRQAPTELKHSVIKRCLFKGEPVKLVAEEIGYTPSLIYKWNREYRKKGCFSPMKKTATNIDVNPTEITSAEDVNELKAQMLDMYLRKRIIQLFHENRDVFGYRKIHMLLHREETKVSEKVIRRIMRQENLMIRQKRRQKYNSYKGEITSAVDNVIYRNFHATKPNQKWLTDITVFL